MMFEWPEGLQAAERGLQPDPGAQAEYGHMGASAYEITVDSLLSIRRPRRLDCL